MSANYKVGYKRPPKHTRFKSGQSGNPKGRPKGCKNLATDLEEELNEKVVVNEGNKQLVTTKQRALLKALLTKALKGDAHATKALITLKLGLEHATDSRAGERELLEEDKVILKEFEDRILNKASKPTEE